MTLEINSSRIKFGDLLNLVDKAIDTGKSIQIRKSLMLQSNSTIRFLKWIEKHKIISLIPIGTEAPKKISIKSRKRKIEISIQLLALDVSIVEIAERFNVKVPTAQGYFKELGTYTDYYRKVLGLVLRMKKFTPDSDISSFPSFPIRITLSILKERLSQNEYDHMVTIGKQNRYIKIVTGQKLGTSDLSILLPE